MQKWTDRLLLLLLPLVLLLAACAPNQEPPVHTDNPPEPPVSQPEEWQVDETSLTDDYLISLVIGMETALPRTGSFTFSDPTELTTDQLHSYFLLLTGEDECTQFLPSGAYTFYIPEEFILSKLSEYFKKFRFDFTDSNGYDPDSNRVVVQRFSTARPDPPDMRILSKSLDGNIVTFTGGFYHAGHPEQGQYLVKTYSIEFYEGGYYYLSAVVSDPPPEEAWRVDPATLTDDYLISLVGDMERALPRVGSFTFSDPAELTTDQLYSYFLLLTSKDECAPFLPLGSDTFYIPEEFILSRLSAYFKEFHFDITAHSDYIPTTNSIATWSIPGFRGGPSMRMLSKSIDGGIVTFTAGFYNDGHPEQGLYLTKTYSIEFYEGGYYYLSAVVSDPPPEEPWRVDEAMLTDQYLIDLVLDKESALSRIGGFTFDDPTELTSSQLHVCFLLLTSHDECSQFLRKGAWQGHEMDTFYIPEDFILSRLSKYFKEFHYDITEDSNYDPAENCIVTWTVTGFGGGPDMDILSKSFEGNTVTFTGGLYWYQEARDASVRPYFAKKTYTIEFYEGGYYYLSAIKTDD